MCMHKNARFDSAGSKHLTRRSEAKLEPKAKKKKKKRRRRGGRGKRTDKGSKEDQVNSPRRVTRLTVKTGGKPVKTL